LALAVQDDYQAVGLGRHLLGRLAGLARAHGFTELQGETLVENEPMLHLLRSSGYQVRTRLAGHLCEFSLLLS
jgi:ribosomal protein S18 acetylase RimI-like enzyme